MGMSAVEEMNKFKEEKEKRERALNELITQPFNLENEEHINALKKYLDNFEFAIHKRNMLIAVNHSLLAAGCDWLISRVFTYLDFTPYLIILGCVGYFLKETNKTDFSAQLDEMQKLYNWSLKDGEENYDPKVDNANKLKDPTIQRMIKVLAPVCKTDFMIAWERLLKPKKESQSEASSWGSVLSKTVSSMYSGVFGPQRDVSANIKRSVESRAFDLSLKESIKRAVEYFYDHLDGTAIITYLGGTVKNMIVPMIPEEIIKKLTSAKIKAEIIQAAPSLSAS